MIEITRFYDPPETRDQLDVSVSIEVEGTDGERVLELSGALETAAIDAHRAWLSSDAPDDTLDGESTESESNENDQPSGDSEMAAAKAICAMGDYEFVEASFGDAKAAVFRDGREMTVEVGCNGEQTLKVPLTSELQGLIESARWLGANEN